MFTVFCVKLKKNYEKYFFENNLHHHYYGIAPLSIASRLNAQI